MELAVAPSLHRPSSAAGSDPLVALFAPYVERSVVGMLDPGRIDMVAEDLRAVQRRRAPLEDLWAHQPCGLGCWSPIAMVPTTGGRVTSGRLLWRICGRTIQARFG